MYLEFQHRLKNESLISICSYTSNRHTINLWPTLSISTEANIYQVETPAAEIEPGDESMAYRTSFYKNAWAMVFTICHPRRTNLSSQFTDSTSYQALFYFLVIKPSITLILSIFVVLLALICFVLVLPARAFFRGMRKLGIWQTNVAIEGLLIASS